MAGKKISAIVFMLLLPFIASCEKQGTPVSATSPKASPSPVEQDIAPSFTLKDINGNTTSTDNYKGRIIMIEFGATWCAPCIELAPKLVELYGRYKDKGFVLLSILAEDEGEAAISAFIKEYGITYPVLLDNSGVFRLYEITGIPASFIINKEGRIVKRHLGAPDNIMQELTSEIERLL